MGLFSDSIEKELFQMYVQSFIGMGMSRREAAPIVKGMLKMAKENSIKEKTYNLPPNFGNYIVENYEEYPEIKVLIEKARKEGATDEDIRGWWNLHDLERHMVQQFDNHCRMVGWINSLKKGISEDEAANEMRKFSPIFGDPEDTSHTNGDDRPLPYELKDRVNIYIKNRVKQDPNKYKNVIENSSTLNALIKKEIRAGNI